MSNLMLNHFDDLFNGFLRRELSTPAASRSFSPPSEVDETDTHYVLSLDVPGVAKDDLDIEVENDRLVITGERKGFRAAKFTRAFTLPAGIKAEALEASHENGVLRVLVPKEAEAKKTKIKIGPQLPQSPQTRQ